MSVIVTRQQPVQMVAAPPQAGPTVVFQNAPHQPPPFTYATQQSLVLGILQIVCGTLSIILNIVLIAETTDVYVSADSGYGIWCGVFFLISGGLGIGAAKASKTSQYGLVVAHMVMSIFSSMFAGILLIAASVGSVVDDSCTYNYSYYYGYRECNGDLNKILNIVLLCVALFEGVLAIWASAICCSACCCRQNYRQGAMIAPMGTVQYTTTSTNFGQPNAVVYHTQPQYPQPYQQPPQYYQQPQQQPQFQQQQQQYMHQNMHSMGPGPSQPPEYAVPVPDAVKY